MRLSAVRLFRSRRSHFQRPDRHRAHVHSGAEIPRDVPCFRRTEPVSLAFVDHVVKPPGRLPGLVRACLRSSAIRHSPRLCPPRLLSLRRWSGFCHRQLMPLAAPIWPSPNFITLKSKIFFSADMLHRVRHNVAQAGQIRIPLAGKLVGLNIVFRLAARVVAEILAIPQAAIT